MKRIVNVFGILFFLLKTYFSYGNRYIIISSLLKRNCDELVTTFPDISSMIKNDISNLIVTTIATQSVTTKHDYIAITQLLNTKVRLRMILRVTKTSRNDITIGMIECHFCIQYSLIYQTLDIGMII